jgi:hypothetical protein
MTANRPTAIPGDVTIIAATAPQDADTVAATVARTLADARTAALPLPGYVHQHAGPAPSAGLQFTAGTSPQAAWDALRAWARRHHSAVIAAESPTRPGTYTARVKWTSDDGIEFEAYASISAAPQENQ